MTCEVAILNKEAVALAADSAVTATSAGREKVFASGNKLFALSKYQPVGIMFYGNAFFMGIPWETIVKVYRSKLGKGTFPTLREYAGDFIAYLNNDRTLFPPAAQEQYVQYSLLSYIEFVKTKVMQQVERTMTQKHQISESEVRAIVVATIRKDWQAWKKADTIPSVPENLAKEITDKYREFILQSMRDTFEDLPVPTTSANQLMEILGSLFCKYPESIVSANVSGVVIAGFGQQDTFPSLHSFNLEGIANDRLKYREFSSVRIGVDTDASIMSFAQSEMVTTFMEGIGRDLRENADAFLNEAFNQYPQVVAGSLLALGEAERRQLTRRLTRVSQKLLTDYRRNLSDYIAQNYSEPVINTVAMLPKDELAAMAEALVSLTSFKRRVTMETETVGGPIDVAVISKGAGLIWLKRKHYFKPELNPQFFANYNREA